MGFATNKLLACAVMALFSTGILTSWAQETPDTLYLKSGEEIKGEVKGKLPDGSVNFKFAQGTIPYRMNVIQKIDLGERPQLKEAQKAAEAEKYDEVISLLTPVVDQFLGFQSPWVGQAAGELANALAQSGKTFKSVELAKRISELYPGHPMEKMGAILEANTLLSQGKVDEALSKLTPLKDDLPVKTSPSASEMQLLGDYHFAMGLAMEKKNQPEQALEHFLTVAAVYPTPKKRAADAQQKADALLAANAGLMVP